MENSKKMRNFYTIRFSDSELVELQSLMSKFKYSKVSTLIKKVLFNREITIVTRDESLYDAIEKLSNLLYQYNKVGVNYNQTVKHLHRVFNEKTAHLMLQILAKHTTELVQITEKFVPIVDSLKEKYTAV
jgi:hypothetical protein